MNILTINLNIRINKLKYIKSCKKNIELDTSFILLVSAQSSII